MDSTKRESWVVSFRNEARDLGLKQKREIFKKPETKEIM
jgi:hypothetical protein